MRTCIYCAWCNGDCTVNLRAIRHSQYLYFCLISRNFNVQHWKKNHFNIHIMQVGPNISEKIVILTFQFRLHANTVAVFIYNFFLIFVRIKVWHNYCDVDDDDDFGVLMRFNVKNVLYVLLIWSLLVGRLDGR